MTNSGLHPKAAMLIIMVQHGTKSTNKMVSFGPVKMKLTREHHICFLIKNSIIRMVERKYLHFHIVHRPKDHANTTQFASEQEGSSIIIYRETRRDAFHFYTICDLNHMWKYILIWPNNMVLNMMKKFAYSHGEGKLFIR